MSHDYSHLINEIIEAKHNDAKVTLWVRSREVVVQSARQHGRDHNMVRLNDGANEMIIHGRAIDAVVVHGPSWLDSAG